MLTDFLTPKPAHSAASGVLLGFKQMRLVIMETGNHIDEVFKEGNWQQRRLERIQKYIEDHLSADLSAPVVAEKFDISASTLHYQFKKYLSQGYQRYVEKVRMRKAMEMTRAGKRMREIQAATGYTYRSPFNKAFKRIFKYPPFTFKFDRGNESLATNASFFCPPTRAFTFCTKRNVHRRDVAAKVVASPPRPSPQKEFYLLLYPLLFLPNNSLQITVK